MVRVFEPSFPYLSLPKKSPGGGFINGHMFNAAMEAIDRPLAETVNRGRVVMPDTSIEQIYNEERFRVPDGGLISIFLPPGIRYKTDFEIKNTHDVLLWSTEPHVRIESETALYGTIDTEVSVGRRSRTLMTFNVGLGYYNGNPLVIEANGGWWLQCRGGLANACLINLNHGVDDAELSVVDFGTQNYFRVHETAPGGGPNVSFWDCELFVNTGTPAFLMNGSVWEHYNCIYFWWLTGNGPGWDMQGSDASLQLHGMHQVLAFGAAGEIVGNPGPGAEVNFLGENIFGELFVSPGTTMSLGAVPNVFGAPAFNANNLLPGAVIAVGTRWRDYVGLAGPATFKDLYWNGALWV